jgi:pimeloyl-ACP methyl ester carboxylesterase
MHLEVDVTGEIHYAEWGVNGAEGPPMVMVHGLGGSLANWMAVAPDLARTRRVVALDLPGFGRTPPAGRSLAMDAQVATVAGFIERVVGGGPCTVVGNSMGGAISAALAAKHPSLVSALILVDPALPHVAGVATDRIVTLSFLAYLTPGLGSLLVRSRRRLSPPRFVAATLALCGLDARRVPTAILDAMAEGVEYRRTTDWGDRSFLEAARSLTSWTVLRRARFRAMLEGIGCPTLLIHGTRDRLVPIGFARAALRSCPGWDSAFLEGVGHVPQLEVPERFAGVVEGWLKDGARRPRRYASDLARD